MRRALWTLVMAAGALLPGLAAAQDRAGGFRGEGGYRGGEMRAPVPAGNGQRWGGGDRGNWQPRPTPQQAAPQQPSPRPRPFQGQRDPNPGRDWQGRDRPPVPGLQPRPDWRGDRNGRPGGNWQRPDGNRRPSTGWQRDRADWQDQYRGQWDFQDRAAWNRGWRNDDRYDWNRYRAANRGAYRLPRYYAPHGWSYGYRRFQVGVVLSDVLFARNYWIDDPWDYRLPPADEPYRWVRYYDDALLVDLYSGQVVDTVYDMFG